MNLYLLTAGIIAAMTTVGHFAYGRRHFLKPVLVADVDAGAKAVMHCIFHYVSVFLILSSLLLLSCGFEAISKMQSFGVLLFIALNFSLFAIWQIYIGFMSELEAPFKRLFQWVFFVLVAGFTLAGALLS
ncbi:hypothetical protein L2719_15990 [Shewanella schlegeliana]|uniref:DUF423 domain-containing protein n=1 Tax=Shewanella schlegeliana TaxID=190308 RepID=A0ABS1T3E8_9GAMM|nr:hypothetical protein [Shewanella schlegeliana]MBL4915100.1 hypothetical protein [Shewanella schlegeliana]MCL1111034.1 hypothetical protein [Shewanella schlegeliana]GIU29112.1 hypothetical protein TUM4433_18000 [Shewanella schlegeliana]